jgi:carbamoyl-phosphate synthase large subunit
MAQSAATIPVGINEEPKRAVVLLTSAGRRITLVNALRTAADSLNMDLRIVACDRMPRGGPACLFADAAYQIPDPDDGNYVEAILQICVIHRVTLILPTESAELSPLRRNMDRFAAIGTSIAIGDSEGPTAAG